MSETEMSLDDVYSDEVAEPEVETVEVEAEEAEPETTEEPVEAEPEVKPEESTTDSEKDEWTLTAVMDEREKRQAAVKKAEELQAKLDAIESPEDVSIFEDEAGYKEQQDQKLFTEVENAKLAMAKAYAVRELGSETVEAAEKWYADEGMKSPYAIDRVNKAELKFHEAVDLMKQDQARQDPEAYKAELKAEILAEIKAETPDEPAEAITPSLASKRSASKSKVTTEDYEDMLNP